MCVRKGDENLSTCNHEAVPETQCFLNNYTAVKIIRHALKLFICALCKYLYPANNRYYPSR